MISPGSVIKPPSVAGLKPIIGQDLAWLFILARAAERFSADARLLHPVDVVSDYEKTIYDELDLLREAANASQLRRNFEGTDQQPVQGRTDCLPGCGFGTDNSNEHRAQRT